MNRDSSWFVEFRIIPVAILESEYAGYQLLVIYNTNQGKHLFLYIYIYFLYAQRNKEKNFIVVATTRYVMVHRYFMVGTEIYTEIYTIYIVKKKTGFWKSTAS